jgi:hypothetical protein
MLASTPVNIMIELPAPGPIEDDESTIESMI